MASTDLYGSASKAAEFFRLFSDEAPDLVNVGIPAIQELVGGLYPGTLMAIACPTGVGKSNLSLSMLMHSPDRGGMICTEDGPDVVGARILAAETGISSMRIRRKDLDDMELETVSEALARLQERKDGPVFDFRVGAGLDEVEKSVDLMADAGCRFVILDYLQKVRGVSEDRRSEVGTVMVTFQRRCAAAGIVPIIISQLVRKEPTTPPQIHHLKESGDIENECRLIVLGHRDPEQENLVRFRLAKSTLGGMGLRFTYRYEDCGTLRPYVPEDDL